MGPTKDDGEEGKTVRTPHIIGMVCTGLFLCAAFVVVLILVGAFDPEQDDADANLEAITSPDPSAPPVDPF